MRWKKILERLAANEIPEREIGSAIVTLGKPFKQTRVLAAKDLVIGYRNHRDSWVRHEVMWFIAWGGLREYKAVFITALTNDDFVDNRSYAAECLASLYARTGDPETTSALKSTVENEQEDELVRKYAYEALAEVNGREIEGFRLHESSLSDIDWEWVKSVG